VTMYKYNIKENNVACTQHNIAMFKLYIKQACTQSQYVDFRHCNLVLKTNV